MTSSKSMWLAALLIGAWGAYLTQWAPIGAYGAYDHAWLATVICVASWVTTIGLVLDRWWAGILVYLLVAVSTAWVISPIVASGNPLLPYPDVLSNVIAYIPLAAFIAINLFLILATRRHFGRRAKP